MLSSLSTTCLLLVIIAANARPLRFKITHTSAAPVSSARRDAAPLTYRGLGGDYYINAEFGASSSSIPLLVDTGSSVLAVPGGVKWQDCSNCPVGQQCTRASYGQCAFDANPAVPPLDTACCVEKSALSPSYDNGGIKDPSQPGEVVNCYGTGGWGGSIYLDNVSFGAENNPPISLRFVSISENFCAGDIQPVYNYQSSVSSGIIGLGFQNTQDSAHAAASTVYQLSTRSFSLYMCPAAPNTDSSATLGELNFEEPSKLLNNNLYQGDLTWVPVASGVTSYLSYLTNVTVLGGQGSTVHNRISYGSSSGNTQIIFDSGTGAIAILPKFAMDTIQQALASFVKHRGLDQNQWKQMVESPDIYHRLSLLGDILLSDFPIIQLWFTLSDGVLTSLPMSPNIYLSTDSNSEYISTNWIATQLQAGESPAILGNPFLSQYYTIFDQINLRVGFGSPSESSRKQQCGCVYGFRHNWNDCGCYDPQITDSQCSTVSSQAQDNYDIFNSLISQGIGPVSTTPDSGATSSNAAVIVAIAVGGAVLALLAIVCMYWGCYRKQDKHQKPQRQVNQDESSGVEYVLMQQT